MMTGGVGIRGATGDGIGDGIGEMIGGIGEMTDGIGDMTGGIGDMIADGIEEVGGGDKTGKITDSAIY